MISCTEFVYTYSELFKFLEKKGGKQEVQRYWQYLSERYVENGLGEQIRQKGLRGCYDYWSVALSEEAADFTMTIDGDVFTTEMHYCPSKGRLLKKAYMKPYKDYCEHCAALYAPVLAKYGFKYSLDISQSDKAMCKERIVPADKE